MNDDPPQPQPIYVTPEDKGFFLRLLQIRSLVADKENTTARLSRDVAQFGSAQADYDKLYDELDAEIKTLLNATQEPSVKS